MLLLGREALDQLVDCGGRAGRLHRRDDEVTGLGGHHRETHRLPVAQIADDDDVGILAQGAAHGGREALRVTPDFALVHQRLPGRVKELDGVLERQNVRAARLVQHVDERGQRGRLAGTVGPVKRMIPWW